MNQYSFGSQSSGGAPSYGAVAQASVEERAAFITKTYAHLGGAILAFVALEALFVMSGAAEALFSVVFGGGNVGMFIFMALFVGTSYMADRWARRSTSPAMQYAGLGLYVLAQVVIFAPMVVLAVYLSIESGGSGFDLLGKAGLITIVLFGGLTGVVFLTRKDFSFLRSVLMFGGIAALGLIFASIIFGFELGLLFSWAMVVFAAVSILYDTSNVMLHYRPGQHVAASLSLFASFALLLFYVLRIVLASRD